MLGSPGWRTPGKGAPHRSYPTQRSPSYDSSGRSPPFYSPKRSGVLGHRPSHSGSLCAKWIKCRSTIRPNHNDELDVFQSFRTRPQRGGLIHSWSTLLVGYPKWKVDVDSGKFTSVKIPRFVSSRTQTDTLDVTAP